MNNTLQLEWQRFTARYGVSFVAEVRRFLRWWGSELLAALPPGIRKVWFGHSYRLLIDVDPDQLIVKALDSDNEVLIGRIGRDNTADAELDMPGRVSSVVLRLQTPMTLSLQLTMPLAAAENLREAVSFQIPRLTPFAAEAVYFDCNIAAQDAAAQQMTVDLAMVPKVSADALLDILSKAGIDADILTIKPEVGDRQREIDLLPADRRISRGGQSRRRLIGLGLVNLALLAIVAATPILQKDSAISRLEPRVTEAIASARDGVELRRDVERLTAASEYLKAQKEMRIRFLNLLDELSRLTPEHTWVSRLDYDGKTVQMQGQSTEAASLIRTLEASQSLQAVQFRSPVVSIGESGEERFHLSADVHPGAKP